MVMSLESIRGSRQVDCPEFGLVYGAEAVGKSTLLASMDRPVFIDTEGGLHHLDAPVFPRPQSWTDVLAAIALLRDKPHNYKTLCIDSVSTLESGLIKPYIHQSNGWSEAYGEAYGRWLNVARKYWIDLFGAIEQLQERRAMHVWCTAHQTVRTVNNPSGADYSRYRPMIGGTQGPEQFLHRCDYVLWLTREIETKEEDGGRVKARTTGNRWMYTMHSPAYDAKSRIRLPGRIPLDYQSFLSAKAQAISGLAALLTQVRALAAQVASPEKRAAALSYIEKNATNEAVLVTAASRLESIIEEQKASASTDKRE